MAVAEGNLLELDVGDVAPGGVCRARHEGIAVLVRHALPGERVRAVVTEVRADHVRADAVEVLTADDARVVPPCPHAGPGRCGGCDWQHATLERQRALKAAVVRDQLRRHADLDVTVVVEAVAGDVQGLAWRTRVTYAVGEGGVAGLRRHRSAEVHPVDRCRIATDGVHDIGVTSLRWPGADTVEAIASSAGDRAVVVTGPRRRPPRIPVLPDGVSTMRADTVTGPKPPGEVRAEHGRPGVREIVGDSRFWVGGSGFWQVHPGAPAVLTDAVLQALEPKERERALDVYSGVGLFTSALAAAVGERGFVDAIESDPVAVASARQGVGKVPGVRLHEGRADAVLRRIGLGQVDVVVLDPPRAGVGPEVAHLVAALRPRAIALVACDPTALGRDLRDLRALGYRLTRLRAFDLFPMTHHVECVATLVPDPAATP